MAILVHPPPFTGEVARRAGGGTLHLLPQRPPRPRHHLDAANQVAAITQQHVHFLAPPDALRGIPPVFQPVGVAFWRAAWSPRPDAQLNLMFREGYPPPFFRPIFRSRARAARRCRRIPSCEGAPRHPSRRRRAFPPAAAPIFHDARPSPRPNTNHASADSDCPAALHASVPFACPIEPHFCKPEVQFGRASGSAQMRPRQLCQAPNRTSKPYSGGIWEAGNRGSRPREFTICFKPRSP